MTAEKRRQMAFDKPFPHKEGKDPALCLTRMVGPKDTTGKLNIKFISQMTVDLDSPVVFRLRVEFDERDIDIPIFSWGDWMAEVAAEELAYLFPEWQKREKVYGPTSGGEGSTQTWLEWRSPLTEGELVQISLPLVGAEPDPLL